MAWAWRPGGAALAFALATALAIPAWVAGLAEGGTRRLGTKITI